MKTPFIVLTILFLAWLNYRGVLATLTFNLVITAIAFVAVVLLGLAIQQFVVAEDGGMVVGCGALHVMWEDLAEVRTVAVDPELAGRGIGNLSMPVSPLPQERIYD